MNPSKAIELMRIYLADHGRGMMPDDLAALRVLLNIAGIFISVMGAKRARNMLIKGGDFIGCNEVESQQLATRKGVEN